jgi:ketosteroid isomerase-like protein
MSTEENKAIVRRLFDEVWNTGNLDKIEELYAPDFVADYRPYAPLRTGLEGIKDMVRRAWTTFPDYHEELEELVAEGDTVVARFLITGKVGARRTAELCFLTPPSEPDVPLSGHPALQGLASRLYLRSSVFFHRSDSFHECHSDFTT